MRIIRQDGDIVECNVQEYKEIFYPAKIDELKKKEFLKMNKIVKAIFPIHPSRIYHKASKWSRSEKKLLKEHKNDHISRLLRLLPDKKIGQIYTLLRLKK